MSWKTSNVSNNLHVTLKFEGCAGCEERPVHVWVRDYMDCDRYVRRVQRDRQIHRGSLRDKLYRIAEREHMYKHKYDPKPKRG
jgi:hypothetical protein